jgi:hypothetical protein
MCTYMYMYMYGECYTDKILTALPSTKLICLVHVANTFWPEEYILNVHAGL